MIAIDETVVGHARPLLLIVISQTAFLATTTTAATMIETTAVTVVGLRLIVWALAPSTDMFPTSPNPRLHSSTLYPIL